MDEEKREPTINTGKDGVNSLKNETRLDERNRMLKELLPTVQRLHDSQTLICLSLGSHKLSLARQVGSEELKDTMSKDLFQQFIGNATVLADLEKALDITTSATHPMYGYRLVAGDLTTVNPQWSGFDDLKKLSPNDHVIVTGLPIYDNISHNFIQKGHIELANTEEDRTRITSQIKQEIAERQK